MSSLRKALRAYQIYGANTSRAFAKSKPNENIWYLKPISTGPADEADDQHISRFAPQIKSHCLFQFDEAVSPHIAARSKAPPSDAEVLKRIRNHLDSCAEAGPGTLFLETAGGVHSPTPSGSSQADLYRPLRLPICLIPDHKLGGICATISAFESLHVRGYDLDAALQFHDEKYQNYAYLEEYFERRQILTLSIPLPPPRSPTQKEDEERMLEYYENVSNLDEVEEMVVKLSQKHTDRIANLEEMSTRANQSIWYPFTQHQHVNPGSIMTIDSAYGDFFAAIPPSQSNKAHRKELLVPTFDGSASWWTQGLGHGNPDLSLAASYAAGRYGHTILAGTVNEPALKLAESLLQHLGNPRLTKCFFSDNGSTGMEVAMKMALTASSKRYGWGKGKNNNTEVGVIGLQGSYHGDCIGAMDCSEPSTFNERVHWYQGRGYWFDFPQVKMKNGTWVVEYSGPEDALGGSTTFPSLGDIFDIEKRLESSVGKRYEDYIKETLTRLVTEEGRTFGAVIMEPVILGAGGMLFVDPLFQHCLVEVVRSNASIFGTTPHLVETPSPTSWTGLPIIFDEVFTGLYRLGRFSAASLLQTHPDISAHAKLLTGGLVPLCTTLASESIYEAFLGAEKRDALLHGHSYTAHPVGCHVANTSLGIMREMDRSGHWKEFEADWQIRTSATTSQGTESLHTSNIWSMWSREFVHSISKCKDVESIIALGSVLAIKLEDEDAGYNSTAATSLQKRIMKGEREFDIHSRVLGNVFYLMGSLTSESQTLRSIEKILQTALGCPPP